MIRGGPVISTRHDTGWMIDPMRWPDVAVARGSAPRAEIARLLFGAAVASLPIRVGLPGGRRLGAGRAGAPLMMIHNPSAFFTRLGAGGLIGFGESYMAGDWDCADLTGLLTVFAAHVGDLVPTPFQRLRTMAVRRKPAADEQTKAGARRNIGRHYDLSNEFFGLFLDETMTYSSALFETTADGSPAAAGPLLARERDRDHAGAAPRGPDGQLAPAGADLEQPAARPGPGPVQQGVDLAPLSVGQQVTGGQRGAVILCSEHGRGVGHGLVEEQREQLVGQVVVAADVTAGAVAGLLVGGRRAAYRQRAHPLQRGRDEVAGAGGEHSQQAGQVGAVPVAGQVRLAEPDQAGGAEAAEELPGPVQDHDRRVRGVRAEQTAVREPHSQRQRRHRAGEQGPGHGRAHQGAVRRGDVGPPFGVDGAARRLLRAGDH